MQNRNFRDNRFTTRSGSISNKQIEKLRQTKLRNAKTLKEKRFYSSNSFTKKVKQQVRVNTKNKNVERLNKLSRLVGDTKESQKALKSIFAEKQKYNKKTGKVSTVNKLSTKKQTIRIKNALKQVKNGNFSIKQRVKNNTQYIETKDYLSDSATDEEILNSLDRSVYYFENKGDIKNYNRVVKQNGKKKAQRTVAGQKLKRSFTKFKNDKSDIISAVVFGG